MHQLSRAPDSITLSWPQPDRPNGDILEYQIRFYDKVHALSGLAHKHQNIQFYPLQNHNMSFCVPQGSDVDSAASVYSETNTLTVTSLIPGSIYAFQIRARNERGYGPYSNTIYFTTLPLGTTLSCCHSYNSHYSHEALFHHQCEEPLVLGTSQPGTKMLLLSKCAKGSSLCGEVLAVFWAKHSHECKFYSTRAKDDSVWT